MLKEAIRYAKSTYEIEAESIHEMLKYFDEEAFGQAVELLAKAERIGTSGCGH